MSFAQEGPEFRHFSLPRHFRRGGSAALEPFREFADSHVMLHGHALHRNGDHIHRSPDACNLFGALQLFEA